MIKRKLSVTGDNYKELYIEQSGDSLILDLVDLRTGKAVYMCVSKNELLTAIEQAGLINHG